MEMEVITRKGFDELFNEWLQGEKLSDIKIMLMKAYAKERYKLAKQMLNKIKKVKRVEEAEKYLKALNVAIYDYIDAKQKLTVMGKWR